VQEKGIGRLNHRFFVGKRPSLRDGKNVVETRKEYRPEGDTIQGGGDDMGKKPGGDGMGGGSQVASGNKSMGAARPMICGQTDSTEEAGRRFTKMSKQGGGGRE